MFEEITRDDYWDCECETNYIHPKTQRTCSICNVNADDQPDSIAREVEIYLGELSTDNQDGRERG